MIDKNQRIVFSDNTDLVRIISDILTKNEIGETIQQANEKLEKGKTPIIVILSKTALDVAAGKIIAKDLPSLLQKELEIEKEKAEKIAGDIKTQLIPLTTKVFIDPDEIELEESKTIPNEPFEPQINITETAEKSTLSPMATEKPKNKADVPLKKIKKPNGMKEADETPPETRQPTRGPDNYREPIE